MKNKKCIVFDFTKGRRADIAHYQYKNGQLDLDLKIEVKSPVPAYSSNVIEFRKQDKKSKNSTCTKEQAPSYTA